MATSELLIATPGLFAYPSGSVDNQKVPNLLCQSLIPCRRLYSDGSRTRTNEFSRLTGLRPSCPNSATTTPHTGLRVVLLTKRQRSLYAAAWNLACPASGRDVYDRACIGGSLRPYVGANWVSPVFSV